MDKKIDFASQERDDQRCCISKKLRMLSKLWVADVRLSGSGAYNALRGGCGRDAPLTLSGVKQRPRSDPVPAALPLTQSRVGRTMKELVEAIAKALVDNPDQVQVRAIEGEQITVFELRVHASDLGILIGRQGRNAEAIRTILAAVGMKLRKRFTLEILD